MFLNSQIKCSGSRELKDVSNERREKIIEKSKIRKDSLGVEIENRTERNEALTLVSHRNCISTYTSDTHIQRHINRQARGVSQPLSPPAEKRIRRSEVPNFTWMEQCFFCGEPCAVEPDPKNPSRHREAYECHTSDRSNLPTFKEAVLKVHKVPESNWVNRGSNRGFVDNWYLNCAMILVLLNII